MPGPKVRKQTWIDHLNIGIELHRFKDIHVIEHQDCGAYKTFLKKQHAKSGEFNRDADFAMALATETHQSAGLNVHCFYLVLRGNVKHIYSLDEPGE